MKIFHIIQAKYIPVTETKPARIRIHSARFKQTIFVSIYQWETAVAYLKSEGFKIVGTGFIDNEVIIASDTFKPLKK